MARDIFSSEERGKWSDWGGWGKDTKGWNYYKPFHRINSPSYESGKAPTGNGFECGCRDELLKDSKSGAFFRKMQAVATGAATLTELIPMVAGIFAAPPAAVGLVVAALGPLLLGGAAIVGGAVGALELVVRTLPNWVPVRRGKGEPQKRAFQEIEGVLVRSFMTWTDTPMLQWHRWFDWNFHISPAQGFEHVKGPVNKPPEVAGPLQPLVRSWFDGFDGTMEGEWDCGAFGQSPGIMLTPSFPFWPMTGDYLWLEGRWIYDCGHSIDDRLEKDRPKPPATEPVGETLKHRKMRSEIHPIRAMASARWEAFWFKELGVPVPAIQFLFFASTKGGYYEFKGLGSRELNPDFEDAGATDDPKEPAKKYEFLIDLPLFKPSSTWTIGHEPDFPLNTGVLRDVPQLLKDIKLVPFGGERYATGVKTAPVEVAVELAANFDPEKPQAKVTITLPDDSAGNTCGVLLTLGWNEPELFHKIRQCTVSFDKIHIRALPQDQAHFGLPSGKIGESLWTVRYGVNGRWFQQDIKALAGDQHPIGFSRTFLLSEDDIIRLSAHGQEEQPVGEIMTKSDSSRSLNIPLGGTPFFVESGVFSVDWFLTVIGSGLDNFINGIAQLFGGQANPGFQDLLPFLNPTTPVILLLEEVASHLPGHIATWKDDIDVPGQDDASEARISATFLAAVLKVGTTLARESFPLGMLDPFVNKRDRPPTAHVAGSVETPLSLTLDALLTSEVGATAELAELNPHGVKADKTLVDNIDVLNQLNYTLECTVTVTKDITVFPSFS